MKFDLYGDGIGTVEYVQHMGEDITIVNSARVSFGKHKEQIDDKDRRLIRYLIKHKHTRQRLNTMLLHLGLWYLFLCVVSTTAIELFLITKLVVDILKKILDFMSL